MVKSPGKRVWKHLTELKNTGGVYAFIVPVVHFDQRTIHLHAPKSAQIPFTFAVNPLPVNHALGVVYVGRATKLKQRFQFHFAIGGRKYGGQVKHGLKDCGLVQTEEAAVMWMLENAKIVYHDMPEPEQTANRDLVELTLCSKHMPPFNVKSER